MCGQCATKTQIPRCARDDTWTLPIVDYRLLIADTGRITPFVSGNRIMSDERPGDAGSGDHDAGALAQAPDPPDHEFRGDEPDRQHHAVRRRIAGDGACP